MEPFPSIVRWRMAVLGAVLSVAFLASPAMSIGRFEQLDTREIPVPDSVADITVASDGSHTFVLTVRGQVHIYDAAGRKIQTMEVGRGFDRLEYDDSGNRLFLGGSGQKNLKIISMVMRFELDTKSSPYRGPEDAPVTIVVYDDFQ